MAPSSARVNAPAPLNSPPMTQTSTIPLMNGTLSATLAAGTRKIPEPITEPTTTQNASTGPSTRGNFTDCRSSASTGIIKLPPIQIDCVCQDRAEFVIPENPEFNAERLPYGGL